MGTVFTIAIIAFVYWLLLTQVELKVLARYKAIAEKVPLLPRIRERAILSLFFALLALVVFFYYFSGGVIGGLVLVPLMFFLFLLSS
jgi:hypothetical protein